MADFRPDFLFTEERIAEGRKWQEEMRLKHGVAKVHTSIKALQNAAACTEATLGDIRYQLELGDEEGLKHSYTRLAELLTEQGYFEEAAEAAKLSNDSYWTERTAQLLKALVMPDADEHCDCPNFSKEKDPKTQRPISNNYHKARFLIDGQWHVEHACNLCGASNVKQEK